MHNVQCTMNNEEARRARRGGKFHSPAGWRGGIMRGMGTARGGEEPALLVVKTALASGMKNSLALVVKNGLPHGEERPAGVTGRGRRRLFASGNSAPAVHGNRWLTPSGTLHLVGAARLRNIGEPDIATPRLRRFETPPPSGTSRTPCAGGTFPAAHAAAR